MKSCKILMGVALALAVFAWCAAEESPPMPPPPGAPGAGAPVAMPPPPMNVPANLFPPPPGVGGPAAPGGEDAAAADKQDGPRVRVFLDSDVLHMKDGSELKCTVILESRRNVVILTDKGEEMIPRGAVDKIERARDQERFTTLPVRSQDGFQFIVMEPIEEAPIEGQELGAGGPGAGGGKPAIAPPKRHAPPQQKAAQPKKAQPKKTAAKPDSAKPDDKLKKLPMSDQDIQKLLGGGGTIADIMRKANEDPAFRDKIKQRQRPSR